LQQVQHARSHGQVRRAHELSANKREIHLIVVKYCENTRPGHQLEASDKQYEGLCTQKLKKLHFTPSFLVWEDQSIPLTLCII